jgi:putative ABC transport system permease protein
MIKYYIKFAYRNILKNKVFSLINVVGLSIGIACCILAFLYIQDQLGYDKHFSNTEDKYLFYHNIFSGNTYEDATPLLLLPELQQNFPEIQSGCRIHKSEYNLKINGEHFYPKQMLFVDSNFYSFLGWDLVYGNPHTSLQAPYSVTISEKKAHEFFGDENPVGKNVLINLNNPGTITGVFKDLPDQSHIQADFIVSMSSLKTISPNIFTNWGWFGSAFYLKINEQANFAQLEEKVFDHWKQVSNEFGDSENASVHFQKFSDVYLHSANITSEFKRGNMYQLVGIGIISLLILIIACFNFINLSTAILKRRFTEAGIKKTVGATKRHLGWQIFVESALYVLTSLFLSCLLVSIIIPVFNNYFDINLAFSISSNSFLVVFIFCFSLLVLLVNHIFPSLSFRRTKAITLINQPKAVGKKYNVSLWNILVVSQFVIGIFLIIGTLLIKQQMEFIRTKNLGFNKENILVIENDWDNETIERYNRFKESLRNFPEISGVSGGLNVPANGIWNWGEPQLLSDNTKEVRSCGFVGVDHDYFDVLGARLLLGRNFSNEYNSDDDKIIISKTCQKRLGIENPIGEIITNIWGKDREIIGVVDDIQYNTIHEEIKPAVFVYKHEWLNHGVHIVVKFQSENISQTLSKLKNTWDSQNPTQPFGYFFLDKSFEEKYKAEAQNTGHYFHLIVCHGIIWTFLVHNQYTY